MTAALLTCLAEDLTRFADALEAGPSGWQIVPLLALASEAVRVEDPVRHARTQGALFAIVYGTSPSTKANVLDEIRRVVAAIQYTVSAT